MPATLKSALARPVVERIAAMISGAWPAFDGAAFVADAMRGLSRKELLARGDHVASALRRHLPPDYAAALRILVASLGPPLADDGLDGAGTTPFLYLPHVAFVRAHGLADLEASMAAQHALTRRFTAEWSLRPFLEHAPERTLRVLRAWVDDPSPHVRRLVSEGTRPRLPWAPRLRAFAGDPSPVLALLERLRDDPSAYVRRSVANHLNDVAKDRPELVVALARRWLAGATPERRRLVRHALRTLLKQGHRGALEALGHGAPPRVAIRGARVEPPRVRIGERARFTATLEGASDAAQSLSVELAVRFVKRDGRARAKVFRLRTVELPAGGRVTLSKQISLALHSTRTPHPGVHAVELRVNGVAFSAGAFEVVRPRGRVAPARRGRALPSRRAR